MKNVSTSLMMYNLKYLHKCIIFKYWKYGHNTNFIKDVSLIFILISLVMNIQLQQKSIFYYYSFLKILIFLRKRKKYGFLKLLFEQSLNNADENLKLNASI